MCIFRETPFVSSDHYEEDIKLALALSAEEAKKPTEFDQGGCRYSSFQPHCAHSFLRVFD